MIRPQAVRASQKRAYALFVRKIISSDSAKLVSDSACHTRPLRSSGGQRGAPTGCTPAPTSHHARAIHLRQR